MKPVILFIAVLICFAFINVTGCSVSEQIISPANPSETPETVPSATVAAKTEEPTPTQDDFELNYHEIYLAEANENMIDIIELAKKYSKNSFSRTTGVTTQNQLQLDYEGGVKLSFAEYNDFKNNLKNNLKNITLYDYTEAEYNSFDPFDREKWIIVPASAEIKLFYKKADLNHDGTDEIITSEVDGGSRYHAYTFVFTLNSDQQYVCIMSIANTYGHRVVEYNERFYLVEVLTYSEKSEDLGYSFAFDIVSVDSNWNVEAVRIVNGDLRKNDEADYVIRYFGDLYK